MEWNQLFPKKEDWQRKTFDSIKSDLISARNNRFIRYDNAEENHLVMIYGKSQVGKTTLILNMIGVKSECFSNVYETLRAGVPRGNSSTSTAIIYSKSVNEKYGCALTSVNDLSAKEIKYFDENGMIEHLKNIREDVESNRINPDSILFIYIPGNYFIKDSTINSISIMDMPGIESRNHKEDIHVQSLMTKYIPISSVCIIACRSNDIQSLETTVLPNQMDWKRMNHRFILVVTHAYNDGTTKQYFKVKPSERKRGFYEYVRETYTDEIQKILGKHNQTEVYPIDVGDTLTRLCNEEIKSSADREEIIDTKNRILYDLRNSIVNHKGERLKSALSDLKIVIEHYGEDELRRITEELSYYSGKIVDKIRLIDRAKKYVEQLSSDDSGQAEFERDIIDLSKIKSQLSQLMSSCVSNLSNQTRQYIINKALYLSSSDGDYLKDKEQAVFAYLRTDISAKIDDYIKKLTGLISQADIDIDVNTSEIKSKADSDCILVEQNKLYPPVMK